MVRQPVGAGLHLAMDAARAPGRPAAAAGAGAVGGLGSAVNWVRFHGSYRTYRTYRIHKTLLLRVQRREGSRMAVPRRARNLGNPPLQVPQGPRRCYEDLASWAGLPEPAA